MRVRHLAMVKATLAVALALPLVMANGCALYLEDKCWVPPEQYAEAREFYIQTGSLDLVGEYMKDRQWRRCRRNETLYRLQKEFEVLPEEMPEAVAPAEAAADEARAPEEPAGEAVMPEAGTE